MPEVKLILKADNSQHIKAMKEAQTATQKVYDTSEKGGKREKGILEEIDATLVKLNKQKQKAFSYEEIEKYNKKIEEVKQNLKEYETAGLKVEKANEKTSAGFVALAGKVLASIAVWKAFKYIIESTESTALAFHSTVNGLKTGLDKLLKTMVMGEWKEFFKMFRGGMWDAVKAGKEFTIEMDRIKNVHRQFALEEARLQKEIEEQRRIMYESDDVALKTKIEAGEKMLSKMKEKADLEINIADETLKAIVKINKARNNLSEEDLKFVVENFESVESIGKNYEELESKIKKFEKYIGAYIEGSTVTQERIDKLKELQKALGPDAARFAELIKGYDMLTDAEKDMLGNAMLVAKQALYAFEQESRRIYTQSENLKDRDKKDKKAAIDANKKFWQDYEKWYMDNLEKQWKEEDEAKQKRWDKEVKTAEMTKERLRNEAKMIWDYWTNFNEELLKINEEAQQKNFDLMVNSTFALLSFANEMSARNVEQSQTKRELLDQNIADAEAALQEEIKIGGKSIAAKKKELEALKTAQRDALISEQNARSQSKQLAIASMLAEKAIAVAEVVIQTQVANAKAVALFPLTAGLPFTAINNAMMIKSIIAIGIAAALDTIATSTAKFAKGGWTGNGRGRDETGERVAGVVHEKEFVVRRGPASKFIDVLEAINRDDKRMILSSFNKLSPELLGGTMVNNIVVDNQGSNNRLDKLIEENKKLNNRLINSEIIQEFGTMTVVKKGSTIRTIRR